MSWFKRKDKKIEESTNRKDLPNDLWIKGTCCGEILYKPELEKANSICHHCNFHYPISNDRYLKIILDSNYNELFDNIVSTDILNFKANKSYQDILNNVPDNKEAANCYYGSIDNQKVVLAIMDFKFIGGSMGSAVGEKIAKSVDFAIEKNCPLIIICQSGGARMQEGALSLMQLSKVSARLANFSKKGGLYISLLTYPTTGGVTASFGMQADITIAEPKALIGFAGQRVIKQTTSQDLPEGFQTTEFLMEKGFIDLIVDRNTLKSKLINILSLLK